MIYRKIPKTGDKVSVIGFGTTVLSETDDEGERIATVEAALENGINYIDMAAYHAKTFSSVSRAVGKNRSKVYYQMHFGADYRKGEYGFTLKIEDIKKSIDWQLDKLKTDYIDFGYLHCLDEDKDLNTALSEGTFEYIKELQKQGVVRHIGLSTHTPAIAQKILDKGVLDMLMFSINPAYDYEKTDEWGSGTSAERPEVYKRCVAEKVGIAVMKPFMSGQLLDARLSPFGRALTAYQCIQYALDKPGVVTVLPGTRNRKEIKEILGFFEAAEEEKDYSIVREITPSDAKGVCVYCNHCQPCPVGLDVGLINKYYDLTKAGDELARSHYLNLEKRAAGCVECGHCNDRCPFHVDQVGRMKEISGYFGA